MSLTNKTYDDGLQDGKIRAIEEMQGRQNNRLDQHNGRISNLEKVSWLLIGAILFAEFAPQLKAFFNG